MKTSDIVKFFDKPSAYTQDVIFDLVGDLIDIHYLQKFRKEFPPNTYRLMYPWMDKDKIKCKKLRTYRHEKIRNDIRKTAIQSYIQEDGGRVVD